MERRDFLGKIALSGVGLTALNFLNEGSIWAAQPEQPGYPIRNRQQIDFDWRFHLNDIDGANASVFDDKNWRLLDLPHDFGIEGKFDKDSPSGWHCAYLPGGIGWYRKELQWDETWEGRNVFIDFDGIFMNSDIWINGKHLGHWPYGYTTFRYDLTPFLVKGKNVIAVRADNSKMPSARWYSGSGIYRHVWLNVVNPVHVDLWGTYVTTPEITKTSASVRLQTTLVNTSATSRKLNVEQVITNRLGQVVARIANPLVLEENSKKEINQQMVIESPDLWSPNSPDLYKIETIVKEGGEILDRYYTPLGVRKIEVSAEFGFRLNDQTVMIKGVCLHEDAGGAVGSAIPDDVLYFRLKRLKETGCNAVRTAHNPFRPELYTYCDILGLMVLDEAFDGWGVPKKASPFDYGLYFKDWWEKDLGNMLRRDRNHPCVIMWSIGNEVSGYSVEWEKKLVDLVRKLDPTRPITQARGFDDLYIDVAGFNSKGEKKGFIEDYHKKRPNMPVLGTEMPHTRQTRGVYLTQSSHPDAGSEGNKYPVPHLSEKEIFPEDERYYSSSFDSDFFSIDVRDQYKQNKRLPYMMGSFRWTGYDYLGEANNQWPTRSKNKGIFDLAGIATDHYFLYQSLWTSLPMVHLLPHWTHPGKEGVKIPVVAYTNCYSAELFFNGKSLGEQLMNEELQLVWQVPYQPGKLTALAKDEHGTILAETTRQTAGEPYAIKISASKNNMRANRRDVVRLEVSVIDENGILLPRDNRRVYFKINGPGQLIGVENGDILDLEPTKEINSRKVFRGQCEGLVRATGEKGVMEISVSGEGLKPGVLQIMSL